MPELPEVETIRRDLTPRLVGRTITEAWISPDAPRLVQGEPATSFCHRLRGRRIEEIDRRGKYLLLRLDSGLTWIVHLRMTGGVIHSRGGCHEERFVRARFRLDDGGALCYQDVRKLGMMWLVDDESVVVGKLGPEPLGEAFTPEELRRRLAKRSAPVKSVLLDQETLAGVGSIYADEALFEAGVRPTRRANRVSRRETERLFASLRTVLTEAMGNRGSSFRDYVDAEGQQGMHQLHVKVYRRMGEPCVRCGARVKRVVVGGRSAHYCPKCQK